MTDGQLGHVISLLAEGDEVVVDASLVLAGIVEVELFGLDIIFAQLLLLELGDLFEEALFFFHRHAPNNDNAVFEQEHLGDMDSGVEVGRRRALDKGVRWCFVYGGGVLCGICVSEMTWLGFWLQVDKIFPPSLSVVLDFNGAVRKSSLRLRMYLCLLCRAASSPIASFAVFPVLVGCVYALIKQFWVCTFRLRPSFEESHELVEPVATRCRICRYAWQLVPVIFAKSGSIAPGSRVLDPRKLTVYIFPALFVGTVVTKLGIGEQFQLLRSH